MPRVCVPQGLVGGFDHPRLGRILARDGIMTVPDDVARDLIKLNECFPAADMPRGGGAAGFVCTSCGFHGFYRQCKCGGAAVRPWELEDHHAQEPA